MKNGWTTTLHHLVGAEQEHGVLLQPDYDLLAELAEHWPELWDSLIAEGGGSGVVRALVAGIRDPGATDHLASFARERGHDLLLREACVVAIGRSDGPASEGLLLELSEADHAIRRTAMRELARLDSEWGRVTLSLRLDSDDAETIAPAAALARLGHPKAIEALRSLLDAGHAAAGQVLGELAIPSAVPGLLGLLYDDDPAHREVAVIALGEIGDTRALPYVIGSLVDDDLEVRLQALEAIEAITGARPVRLAESDDDETFIRRARTWWSAARRYLGRRRCYYQGRPRSMSHWLEELVAGWRSVLRPDRNDILAARLEMTMGLTFGFDAYQLNPDVSHAALRRWAGWWSQHLGSFPPGQWYWRGQPLEEPRRWP